MGQRLSLAGAQEKTAICLIDDKIAIPFENVPTTHILKTALPKYQQSIQNEYICMKAAREIGITVANVEIRKAETQDILLIERFDRIIKDGKLKRLLQEDFAQSLGIQSKDKYSATFKDCLNVLNKTVSPAKSKQEFLKRVIFNSLIGNSDAHSKNFSIYLHSDKIIELTPAYDLLCANIYDCYQKIAMKIGTAKYFQDIKEKDWKLFANDIEISYKLVQSELKRQKEILPCIIRKLADSLNCEVGYKILHYVEKSCDLVS